MSDTLPTVGRMVHYKSYGTPGGEYGSLCRAAIVAEVPVKPAEEGMLTLFVIPTNGQFHNPGIRHDEDQAGGTWHWPEGGTR